MSGVIEGGLGTEATLELYEHKIFVGDEVKTYQTKVILSYLDSPFLNYNRNTRFILENPIPVRNDDGRDIGYADVFLRNGRLVADLSLDYATPERLASETRTGLQYFPHVKGIIDVDDGPDWSLDLYGKRKTVRALTVLSIKLLPFPTEDVRLDSLGKPMLL